MTQERSDLCGLPPAVQEIIDAILDQIVRKTEDKLLAQVADELSDCERQFMRTKNNILTATGQHCHSFRAAARDIVLQRLKALPELAPLFSTMAQPERAADNAKQESRKRPASSHDADVDNRVGDGGGPATKKRVRFSDPLEEGPSGKKAEWAAKGNGSDLCPDCDKPALMNGQSQPATESVNGTAATKTDDNNASNRPEECELTVVAHKADDTATTQETPECACTVLCAGRLVSLPTPGEIYIAQLNNIDNTASSIKPACLVVVLPYHAEFGIPPIIHERRLKVGGTRVPQPPTVTTIRIDSIAGWRVKWTLVSDGDGGSSATGLCVPVLVLTRDLSPAWVPLHSLAPFDEDKLPFIASGVDVKAALCAHIQLLNLLANLNADDECIDLTIPSEETDTLGKMKDGESCHLESNPEVTNVNTFDYLFGGDDAENMPTWVENSFPSDAVLFGNENERNETVPQPTTTCWLGDDTGAVANMGPAESPTAAGVNCAKTSLLPSIRAPAGTTNNPSVTPASSNSFDCFLESYMAHPTTEVERSPVPSVDSLSELASPSFISNAAVAAPATQILSVPSPNPFVEPTPTPVVGQNFYIQAYWRGGARQWCGDRLNCFLRLAENPEEGVVEAVAVCTVDRTGKLADKKNGHSDDAAECPIHIHINPRDLGAMSVEPGDPKEDACSVILRTAIPPYRLQRLLFRTRDKRTREGTQKRPSERKVISAGMQAQRFCAWVRETNPNVQTMADTGSA
ncbi:hypothetical protein SPI_02555 [Niveomyces insectorum RCEF 264]|uniref:Uncharacterized protein n=1 Tax=Niveomyces insectorum RCEF 264 TaxID=1081102 RepID=A0A162KBV1_9HYPO|nr:hypothetical protein SPI_02555 [Niveomyces insectorum RCEF 264]